MKIEYGIAGEWEDKGMKNRVVKQLFLVSIATTLAMSVPAVSWAADTKKEEEADSGKENKETDDVIEITKDSEGTIVYDENGITVKIQSLSHKYNSGDPFFQIEYMIENNSSKNVTICMFDSYVEDFNVATYGGNTINAGKKGLADLSIWEKDYKLYDIEDFKVWESKIQIYDTEDTLFEKNMNIQRTAFSEESDTSNIVEEEETSSEESQSDDEEKYNDLLQRIEDLEAKNKDLEEKNKELEDKLSETEEEKQQEAEPTEIPVETTPEPTEAPVEEPAQEESVSEETAPETEQKPVVEYKDATTIRIVQQALNDVGYNCGNPDGVAGGKTTEAVTKYQTDKGLTVNGLVTDELLQSLNVVEKVQDAVQKESSKNEYSSDYTYDQLARNPDTYIGQKMKFTGKVLEAGNGDDICYARVELNSNIDTVLFVTYKSDLLGYRLLDDDTITIYGSSLGVYSYKSVGAGTITIPWINAGIIEM